MIRHLLITLGIAVLLCSGCRTKVVEYKTDSSGHLHYVGTLTPDESWKQIEKARIDAEVAGEHPDAGKQTWKEYWQWSYKDIRLNPGPPPWHSTDFKTADDMVRWIERQRSARGLPPYN
jgi:hypothetical protein